MSDYSNIPLGLKITTQIPLDVKTYVQNEDALKDLGLNDNLAFTYVQGSTFYCIEEGTRYEWREVVGAEVGLRTPNYTYPSGIVAFGITYSDKVYNFFPTAVTSQVNSDWNAVSGVAQILNKPTILTPPFQSINEGNGTGYIVRGRVAANYGPVGGDSLDLTTSSEVSSTAGITGGGSFGVGDRISSSGWGNIVSGDLIDSSSSYSIVSGVNINTGGYMTSVFGVGHDVTALTCTVIGQAAPIINNNLLDHNTFPLKEMFVIGNGTIANNDGDYSVLTRSAAMIVRYNGVATLPSVTNALITAEETGKAVVTKEYLYLQKIITYPADFTGTNYTITNSDMGYSVIVVNGAQAVTITVPAGLQSKMQVGFIQDGTADVIITPSGTTIKNAINGYKIKGQYDQVYLEQGVTNAEFYLLGNTKV